MNQSERPLGPAAERRARFVNVRSPKNGKLLFRFDPNRDIIELKDRRDPPVYVDLTQYRERCGED